MPERTLVAAHRGASTLARENSLEAFAKAIELGADMVEFDVRRTADGHLVAFHDERAAGRPLGELTLASLAAALGAAPPRLDEVVELCAGRIGLDVELKERGTEAEALDAVAGRFGPDELVVTSFLDDVVAAVARLRPDVRAGLLLRPGDEPRPGPGGFLAPHVELLESGRLGEAAGLYVWTVNDPERLRRCFADPRVAAVITDDPALALAIRAEAAR